MIQNTHLPTKKNTSARKKSSGFFTNIPLVNGDTIPSVEKYAIIQTGGKQYFILDGKTIAIEKVAGAAGDTLVFNEVLLRRNSKTDIQIGTPHLDQSIEGTIVKQMRGEKIVVFKFKRRKKYQTKKGHRQLQTIVRFTL